jgi:ABC-type Fe3+-hydroxamate transport system substrate-binding protein
MRKTCARSICALALAVLAVGCGSPTEPSSSVLEVSVVPSRAVLVRGDTMHLTVTVRNPTASPVTVSGSSSSLLAFRALDAQGRVLAASDRISTLDLIRRTVPARGTLTRALVWTGNAASGEGPLALVPPGEYRVVGVLNAVEGEQVSAPALVQVRVP